MEWIVARYLFSCSFMFASLRLTLSWAWSTSVWLGCSQIRPVDGEVAVAAMKNCPQQAQPMNLGDDKCGI